MKYGDFSMKKADSLFMSVVKHPVYFLVEFLILDFEGHSNNYVGFVYLGLISLLMLCMYINSFGFIETFVIINYLCFPNYVILIFLGIVFLDNLDMFKLQLLHIHE